MNKDNHELVEIVRKWITIDNQINKLNKTIKQLRLEKKTLNLEMIQVMKQNEIDIFDLKEGQIQYKQEKKKEPLNQKRLLSILSKHPQLEETQIKSLNDFIFENRNEITTETIVRKLPKSLSESK
jgi:seryl-tRNA synthetase